MLDGIGRTVILYAVTPRASLQSDANNTTVGIELPGLLKILLLSKVYFEHILLQPLVLVFDQQLISFFVSNRLPANRCHLVKWIWPKFLKDQPGIALSNFGVALNFSSNFSAPYSINSQRITSANATRQLIFANCKRDICNL